MGPAKFSTTDEYISAFSGIQKKRLQELRSIIKRAAPKATEVISYNMPAVKGNKVLVYYAAYPKHIGFYPTASPVKVFAADLGDYKTSKGTIQFPLEEPLPAGLIKEIVAYRIKEDGAVLPSKKKTGLKK